MTEIFNTLSTYLNYPFVQKALIVGVLIALCSSLLGVSLVLKRLSFIGDGLSHVAFGALAISSVLGGIIETAKTQNGILLWIADNEMIVILPITVLTAVLLLRSGGNGKIKGDAGLAMLSVGALGLGYLLMNKFSTSGNVSGDVCTTLFGSTSILTLSKTDVAVCIVMSVVVIAVFCLFYNRIFAVTFDESFAGATGTNASAYNMLIAVITAVIIVLAMNLVGSLLISALVIFPALSAMRVFKSFKKVVISSAVISVFCSAFGILVSIVASTPVGSTVVAIDILVFIIFSIIGKIKKG